MSGANHNKVLLASLMLSAFAHVCGFYLLWPSDNRVTWTKPGQIQVNVIASSTKHTANNKSRRPEHNPQSSTLGKTHQTNPDVDKAHGSESQSTIASAQSSDKLTVQLRGKIKTALQKHLTYPPVARRRGWQGTVTIQVTIKGNGDLHQVRLSKSSGYSLLDNSALSALQKVGRLTELKPLLQGKSFPIELPIKYLLEDPGYGAPTV